MKLAFVLPRYGHEGEAGGRARDLARRLGARGHSLEVLTTVARLTRASESPREAQTIGDPGVVVRRFPVSDSPEGRGPMARGLLEHLRRHRRDFEVTVFFSCATWAEEHGLRLSPERSILAVHGGRPPMLRVDGVTLVVDTPEAATGPEWVLAPDHARVEVIAPGIEWIPPAHDCEVPPALQGLGRYLLLAAPLEAREGCAVTIDAFLRAEREGRVPLTLVLVGRGRISLVENVHVRQLGDASEVAQDQAMRGALAVLVPSRREAVAPSALRAWRLGRPVIAHGPSVVMHGLLARAGGGVSCQTVEELAAGLELLTADPSLAATLGRQGHDYLEAHHFWPLVLQKWEDLLRRAARGGAKAA